MYIIRVDVKTLKMKLQDNYSVLYNHCHGYCVIVNTTQAFEHVLINYEHTTGYISTSM